MTTRVAKRISVVLVNDNPSERKRVVSGITAASGLQVLAAAAGTAAALRKARETRPDLVLLKLRREGSDSLTLAAALHGGVPESRVVLMGVGPQQEELISFVRAGVSGFIMEDAPFGRVLSTLRVVAQGIQVLPLELTHSLFDQLKGYDV